MKSSKSWIAITLSLLALNGCDKTEPVVIDVSRAESLLTQQAVSFSSLLARRATSPAAAHSLELPPEPPLSAEAGARYEQVQALLREQLIKTEQELLAAWQKDALAQASAEIATLRATLTETLGEFDASLMEQASAIVRNRAAERGRMLARLAFLAGFPPGNTRKPPSPWQSSLSQQWTQEANDLRSRLNQWDNTTYAKLEELIASHHSLRDRARQQVERAIEAVRTSARAEAKRKTEEAMRSAQGMQLDDLLADKRESPPVVFSGSNVYVEGANLYITDVKLVPNTAVLLVRQRAYRYLEIFLRQRGYILARPGEGKDVTGEFITWLKKTLSGSLPN